MIRWGFVGTGAICRTVARPLMEGKVAGAALAAVASRTAEGAAAFATAVGGPPSLRTHASYEALFADPEVDAVYIGTPHPAHAANALAALRAGKAVLCEKPVAMNARETEALVAAARERNLFFMEAMWTRFLPVTRQVCRWIAEGTVGEVRLVQAAFGGRTEWKPEGRLLNKALGGGALLDVGIYPVAYAAMILGTEPDAIQSAAHIGETGVDEFSTALLRYPGGAQAILSSAVRLHLGVRAEIRGTEGRIEIPEFYAPTEATLFRSGADAAPERFAVPHEVNGYEWQWREATARIAAGETESPLMTPGESLRIMRLVDAIRKDWPMRYEADGV